MRRICHLKVGSELVGGRFSIAAWRPLVSKSAAAVHLLKVFSSSGAPFQQSSRLADSLLPLENDLTNRPTDITQTEENRQRAHFTSAFLLTACGTKAGSRTVTHLCGYLLTAVDTLHAGTAEKLACFSPDWNIRLSLQKWMLPGITNEPINQWISWAAIELMRAGWPSGSRGYILGKVINTHTEQAAISKAAIKLHNFLNFSLPD